MKYTDSWGKYLGRNIRLMCKLCADGCGYAADISCGDYWVLDNNRKPKFEEGNGRNIIFIRSDNGNKILLDAYEKKYIDIFEFDIKKEKIEEIQPSQFERTTTILDKIIAFKLCFRNIPNYNIKKLRKMSLKNSFRKRFKIFIGTLKRVFKKRM